MNLYYPTSIYHTNTKSFCDAEESLIALFYPDVITIRAHGMGTLVYTDVFGVLVI